MNQRTTIKSAPTLVIFDCDGVLVDSEPISNRVLANDITAAGWPMTTAESIARFKGGRLIEVQREVEEHLEVDLGETWLAEHYERMFDAFREEITAIPGVLDVLDTLKAKNIPFCVASQGPVRKMKITLGATGIWPRVEGHIYSADMVERPKPAPDLFLHAARSEGFEPAYCVVVEDSATGIRAACAARMRVGGLAPPGDVALSNAGAHIVINRMSELTKYLDSPLPIEDEDNMQRSLRLISTLLLVAVAGGVALAASNSTPYGGEQGRTIKALSQKDIGDLAAGRGWGFAKPAELNGFPGPAHLLELKAEIGLTASQTDRIQTLFAVMNAEARTVGSQFIAAEKALDAAFAAGTVTPTTLEGLIAESARLRGQLRLVHLKTHLATLPLLTHHQVKRYNQLRGYEDTGQGTEHDGKHRH